MKLLLWDIDGTLLLTDGLGMQSMQRAGRDVLGQDFCFEGIVTAGGVDHMLYDQAARQSGFDDHLPHHDRFRQRYIEHLSSALDTEPHRLTVMPGIPALLDSLSTRNDIVMGMVTGNYGDAARAKMTRAGIDPNIFIITSFSESGPDRPGLVNAALNAFHERYNEPIDPAHAVIIGDTPRDVHCAKENGCTSFGVGTGRYTRDELIEAGADVAVDDLSDPTPLLQLIDG